MANQFFKSLYFKDYPSNETKCKTFTLAFSEKEEPYYNKIKNLSNIEIRDLIGIDSYTQLYLIAEKEERSLNQIIKRFIKNNLDSNMPKIKSKDVTFVGSKTIPFQRWYPYIEGYSPEFIKSLLKTYNIDKDKVIYEPFAGTGTTIFASDSFNIKTVFSEVNPLLRFLIETKIRVLKSSVQTRERLGKEVLQISKNIINNLDKFDLDNQLKDNYKLVFNESKYFESTKLIQVLKLRSYIDVLKLKDELLADIITISVLSALIPISNLKKAGDVRFKTEKELKKDNTALESFLPLKLLEMSEDILNMDFKLNTTPELLISNAKDVEYINDLNVSAVITSPPYLNGTNYFRNTKLELWFLKYLQSPNDLRAFRNQALTSGINDVSKKSDNKVNDIDICSCSQRLTKTMIALKKNAYDKRIPVMALNYFEEMHKIFKSLKKHLENNSKVLIDIGDSIFSNVHIATDDILIDILETLNYKFVEKKLLRKRRSRNKTVLSQTLLVFKFQLLKSKKRNKRTFFGKRSWENFKTNLPHQQLPLSKRNWGHLNHSLCSYQGKLKPSIANQLVRTFAPQGGRILDPFSGVGTIPFEASLNGIESFGIDISLPAYYISSAKVSTHKNKDCFNYINSLAEYINSNKCNRKELDEAKRFGFNKTISEYFEKQTLKEILLARRFITEQVPKTASEMLVVSALLHILHGNRPYALSRRSHPIVPYAPQGEFVYKSLIEKLTEKVQRTLKNELPLNFVNGKIYNQDINTIWPQEINMLDAIITSPPFFDSTRFYQANWLRIWFSGWSEKDFKHQISSFIEEKQKKSFDIYKGIFRQSRERLKSGGVCVLHLGKSNKCDMAEELQKVSRRWFRTADLFDESVAHCESHGFRDKGTVTSHQYLVLT